MLRRLVKAISKHAQGSYSGSREHSRVLGSAQVDGPRHLDDIVEGLRAREVLERSGYQSRVRQCLDNKNNSQY